jgi:hypothetical protein
MAKAVKNIVDISEGINSDASAKLISDQSVADAVNVNISRIGKIQSAIGFTASLQAIAINNHESGLYAFRTDDNSATPAEYLLVQNGVNIDRYDAANLGTALGSIPAPNPAGMVYSNGSLFIYPKESGNAKILRSGDYANSLEINYDTLKPTVGIWLDDVFQAGSETPTVQFKVVTEGGADFTASIEASGSINFAGVESNGQNFKLRYQGTDYSLGTIFATTDSLTFMRNMRIAINGSAAPIEAVDDVSSLVLTLTSTIQGTSGNGSVRIERDTGTPLETDVEFNTMLSGGVDGLFDDGGNIDKVLPSGKYSLSASYVLWDGSETNIDGATATFDFDDRKKAKMQMVVNVSPFNNFITGVKFYLESESFEYSLLGEYRHDDTKRFKFYNENEFKTDSNTSAFFDIVFPLYSTYRFESGYDIGERATPKMKKFLIINNRGYALNVNYGSSWNQDRIIVSPQGKPFLLPENNKIDIVTEDGDEYITAEHFGSFLFCFKRMTLFILNIGSNDPSSFYLSDSIFGVGVDNEAAVCRTEVGVFWANKDGIYHHNGEESTNTVFGKIEDEWKAIDSTVIRCGYDIINKKVVIVRGNVTYSIDIRTGAFSKFNTIGTGNKSNFTVRDKKLSLIVDGHLKEFSTDSGSVSWSIITKDFDLDRRAVRKKVRRFYVTFEDRNITLANFTLSYALDNTGIFTALTDEKFINIDDDDAKNTVVMFDLPRSITAYSVQLKIESTLQTSIKDVSIIYRHKHPK